MRLKKIFIAMLSLAMLFALCACQPTEENEKRVTYMRNYAEGTLDADIMSVEWADEYLLAHGYSQEFVDSTGGDTKMWLTEEAAVFQAESVVSPGGIDGFSGRITVSDVSVPESEVSIKIATFSWEWSSAQLVEADTITFDWQRLPWESSIFNVYSVLSGYSMFEIFGTGTLEEWRVPEGEDPVPQTTDGTFLLYTSIPPGKKPDSGPLLQTIEDATRVSYQFNIDPNIMFIKFFNKIEASGSSDTTITGSYSIDSENYRGSYSVKLIKKIDHSDLNADGNTTLTATYRHGEEEQSVSCTFTDFLETA